MDPLYLVSIGTMVVAFMNYVKEICIFIGYLIIAYYLCGLLLIQFKDLRYTIHKKFDIWLLLFIPMSVLSILFLLFMNFYF